MRSLICDKMSDQLKLGFALWNRQAVSQRVHERLGVELPIRTVGENLKRRGCTPQKPAKKAEVRRWLAEEYPQIAARAKAEQAEIDWGDETALRSDDVRGCGYALKGHTPVVVNNKRKGLSMISTMTNQGKVRRKIFEGAMHADLLVDFFRRLVKDAAHQSVLDSRQPEVGASRP